MNPDKLRIILYVFFLFSSMVCHPQTFWKIENQNGEDILLTISENRENQTFIAHTRKDALKDIAGSITFLAAKTAGILKYPEIVHAEGKVTIKADTMLYNGSFTYLNQTLKFTGKTWNDHFKGKITDNKESAYYLLGERSATDKPLHDYPAIVSKAFSIFEKYYFDRGFIRSSDWKNFKNKVNEMAPRIADDYELAAAIYWTKRNIPDVAFEIERLSKSVLQRNRDKGILLRELNPKTVLVDLNNLPDDEHGMDQLFGEINRKAFTTLIIDARGRKNIQPNSALLLADHLTDRAGMWGAYVTRKWMDTNGSVPKTSEYEKQLKSIRFLAENKKELYNETGCYLKPEPASPIFRGQVYLLNNKRTSGVAEALAFWMKSENNGTLVGQKSAGSPMLNWPFNIDNLYYIQVRFALFYDKEGLSFFINGVEPEIKTGREDALGFLLKKIE